MLAVHRKFSALFFFFIENISTCSLDNYKPNKGIESSVRRPVGTDAQRPGCFSADAAARQSVPNTSIGWGPLKANQQSSRIE